ncbi:hypothetical protein [Fulvivirga ligni]|uniref:hypothetical protein n=1 Tax=Fulvivirga ligni TaxID=2904246 RepID=UPI001F485373|nr:hypothetical protein [Fulvivirga ligni]UII18976.1 hypothetical protein LVD16_14115 [Fulvivirga ligni]
MKVTLSDVIGKSLVDIRYKYVSSNEYGMQEFHSYLKLNDGNIIQFPKYDGDVISDYEGINNSYFYPDFDEQDRLTNEVEDRILGNKIEDFFFCYFDGEVDDDKCSYIKLENGIFITEINYGPQGVPVDLFLFVEHQFKERVVRLNERVKSYSIEIKTFSDH